MDTSLKGLCHEISFPDFVREYCQYKLVLAFKGIINFGNIFEHCFQTFTRRSVVFTLIKNFCVYVNSFSDRPVKEGMVTLLSCF